MSQEGEHTKQVPPTDRPAEERRLSLIFHYEEGTRVVPLVREVPVVVGRTDAADVAISEESLSRRHARFTWRGNGVWVEDMQSTNGIHVGEQRIEGGLMAPGDEARLGRVLVSVHAMDPESAAQPVISEDAFEQWLERALRASRERRAPLALLMVREIGHRQGELGSWLSSVRGLLPDHARLGLYGPGWLVIGVEDLQRPRALELAQAIAERVEKRVAPLGCATVVAPDDATTAGDLIGAVRALAQKASAEEPVQSVGSEAAAAAIEGPVLESAAMRALYEEVRRVALSKVPVLICGETGVGKELVAGALHAEGPRAARPLVAVNCGAVPESLAEANLFGYERGAFTGADRRRLGFFEQANGGTIFLDEIGELSLSVQAALLRTIETQRIVRVGSTTETPIDVRIVAATNRDLEQSCGTGAFRSDLLFRLNTVTLRVPPLRTRPEEIRPLAEHFLHLACKSEGTREMRFSGDAMTKLMRHSWPGNVRELRNAVERAVVLAAAAEIQPEDLHLSTDAAPSAPATIPAPAVSADLKAQVRAYEAELIMEALKRCDYNQTEAARSLRMPVRTLAHKIQQYGLRQRFPS